MLSVDGAIWIVVGCIRYFPFVVLIIFGGKQACKIIFVHFVQAKYLGQLDQTGIKVIQRIDELHPTRIQTQDLPFILNDIGFDTILVNTLEDQVQVIGFEHY